MSTPAKSAPNITTLLKSDMNTPLDPTVVSQFLSSPPFIPLTRALNTRDLGLLPPSPIPPGLLYRSGAIHAASPADLQALGIKLILDLRSAREIAAHPTPSIPGVQNVHIECTRPPNPIVMEDFAEESGVKAYVAMYIEVLEIYLPSFKFALEHVRDKRTPLLFHCTAGKDRTGVLAALLLVLAGAERESVAFDYESTRVGVEPGREVLMGMLKGWNGGWTRGTVGMDEFVQVKGEFILGFLEEVEGRWGSVEGWVVSELGWSEGEVEVLKEVLRGARKADLGKGNVVNT